MLLELMRRLTTRTRAFATSLLVVGALVAGNIGAASAHEGHDDGEQKPAAGAPSSPRVVATSEKYSLVGIAEGEVLVIYLDRAEDNAPVTTATLEVSLNGEPFTAEIQEKAGTYEITAPLLRKPGQLEVLVSIAEGNVQDLLIGTLSIHASGAKAATPASRLRNLLSGWRSAVPRSTAAISIAGALLLVAAIGGATLSGRRKLLAIPAAIAGLVLVSSFVWAHDGHDHGPDLRSSTGNSPSRRPDGSLFVPKPTQRLLEIRTRIAAVEDKVRTAKFNGRVVANPNRSGIVQSTLQGRYEPPAGGVPFLGMRVKAGDLLGRVAPAFQSIDTSDMAQTLGSLDQDIALNRRKLQRQEELLQKNVVARASVEDIRIQLDGLEKRRSELLAAKARPEDLRAPVDGAIASSRVVAGQVVGPSDQLFQIIDPSSLLVEALVFDQLNPDTVEHATAAVGGSDVRLKFLGRSRALQQQYSILQFEIVETPIPLSTGMPVTVAAATGERIGGIVLPRAALAQAANGQMVVFTHKEPEVFVPRAVRYEDFDGENVVITGGISAGDKIVVRNAPLLNQVR
jgi:cobalt-zinc-cadmium efflux system membrane fusion protein